MLGRRTGLAVRLRGAVVGAMILLGAGVPGLASAQPAGLPKLPSDKLLTVDTYLLLDELAHTGHKPSFEALTWFIYGLRTTLTAGSEVYVANGAKQRVCLPSNVPPGDLLTAIREEAELNPADWNARKDDSATLLILQAFARKWPCK